MQAIEDLHAGCYDTALLNLYGHEALKDARERLLSLFTQYHCAFGEVDDRLVVSAPGRTELGGNHTDHNGGRVLAASVDADILAVAGRRPNGEVAIHSSGQPAVTLCLDRLEARPEERRTSAALVRGVAAGLKREGARVGGFAAVTDARVPIGSGLSSSAAFEILIGAVFNYAYNQGMLNYRTLAIAGGYAENEYFDKPSGLMDQIACAAGGVVAVNFAHPQHPEIRRIAFDWERTGYRLCMIDVGGDHASLTDAYASIPHEMRAVAEALGGTRLADTSRRDLLSRLSDIRRRCGDRAVLRAFHFFMENERVERETAALEQGNLAMFLQQVRLSGHSSFEYLQNISPPGQPESQPMAVALCLAQQILGEEGAFRVHGGGFGGCIQTLVPAERTADLTAAMEAALTPGCCRVLAIRPAGSIRLMAGDPLRTQRKGDQL